MHIPDGFMNAPASVAAAAVATGGVAVALRKAGGELVEARAPMTGLVAAVVFSAQMVNFPVAGGTSGHLLGGLLAAVLVGPWSGALAVTVVLAVQSLLFADGGVSALGFNVINMALVPAIAGYGLFVLARRLLPASRTGVLAATAVAAFASVVLAAVVFTFEYALGGDAAAPVATVGMAMVGVHAVIGVGEAIITTLVVGAVLASRADLVHGARHLPAPALAPAVDEDEVAA